MPRWVYRSGRNQRIQFFRFQMRPWSFRATGTKKPLKDRHFWLISALFDMLFALGCYKASWSHLEPKKSNSLVYSGSVDSPGHPGGVLIAEISSDLMFVLIFLCQKRPLVKLYIDVKMIHGVCYIDFNIKSTYFCDICGKKVKNCNIHWQFY